MKYLTKENITFAMALVGFIGTVFTWFLNRRNIQITIFDHITCIGTVAQFFMHIQNQSFSPICISSMSLIHNGNKIECELLPKKIRSSGSDLITTPMFPINLSPRQGCLNFYEFINCQDISLVPGKKVDFVIYTNRGPIKKTVTLGEISHYLHIS